MDNNEGSQLSPTGEPSFKKEGNNQESDTDRCKKALKNLFPKLFYFTPNGAISKEPVFFSDWH